MTRLANKRLRPCESFGLPTTDFYETYKCSAALCEDPFTLNFRQSDKNVKIKDSNSPTTQRYSTTFTETIYTRSTTSWTIFRRKRLCRISWPSNKQFSRWYWATDEDKDGNTVSTYDFMFLLLEEGLKLLRMPEWPIW